MIVCHPSRAFLRGIADVLTKRSNTFAYSTNDADRRDWQSGATLARTRFEDLSPALIADALATVEKL